MKPLTPLWKLLQKRWQTVFWLGPFLTLAGLSAGVVAGWTPIPIGLTIAGFVLLGLWLLLVVSTTPGFWNQRSTQAGANSFIAIVAVLLILGVANYVGAKYSNRIDLTENQLFTLAPQTQEVLRNLSRPVRAVVFQKQSDPPTRTLLEQYRRLGDRFSFEFVDPDARPGLAREFNMQGYGDVFLQSGDRRQFLQSVEVERLSESRLTNAIQQITSDRQSKVYFLQGHGEHPLEPGQESLSQAVALLSEKNFASEALNLVQKQTVPPDASLVVVAGPQQALFEAEVKALGDFLDRGGSLLLLLNPNVKSGLDPLLKDWGVTLDDRVAINASEKQIAGLGAAAAIVEQYGDHPITKPFGNRFSFFPLARPVDVKPEGDTKATPILVTGPQTWAERDIQQEQLSFDPQRDRPGPLNLGFALTRPVKADTKTAAKPGDAAKPATEARLVVIGNSTFAADGFFNNAVNSDVFLNTVSWLSKRDDQVLSIRPKEPKNRRITLTSAQASLIGWTAQVILPLLGFTSAVYMWWRRR